MSALTIRNIPDDVHRGLKALAAKHGRSAEAEVCELIAAAHGFAVATRDTGPFEAGSVPFINPWSA